MQGDITNQSYWWKLGFLFKGTRSVITKEVIAVLLLLCAAAFICIPVWPGDMTVDTNFYINEVRSKVFSDQHAPVINWLWSFFYPLGADVGYILVIQVVAYIVGAYAIFRRFTRRTVAVVAAVFMTVFPPTWGLLIFVGRDTWMLSGLIFAFGMASIIDLVGRRARIAVWAGLIVSGFLVVASRQNAAPTLIPVIGLALWPYFRVRYAGYARRAFGVVAISALAVVFALFAVNTVIKGIVVTQKNSVPAWVYIYDLGAMSVQENQLLIPTDMMAEPSLARVVETFDYDWYIPFAMAPGAPAYMPFPPSPHVAARLEEVWARTVRERPMAYLRVRTREFLRQISLTAPPNWVHSTGIPAYLSYSTRWVGLRDKLERNVFAYFDYSPDKINILNILFRTWIYGLAALILLGWIIFKRSPTHSFQVAAICAFFLHQPLIYIATMGTSYRFEQPVLVAMVFALLTLGLSALARSSFGGRVAARHIDRAIDPHIVGVRTVDPRPISRRVLITVAAAVLAVAIVASAGLLVAMSRGGSHPEVDYDAIAKRDLRREHRQLASCAASRSLRSCGIEQDRIYRGLHVVYVAKGEKKNYRLQIKSKTGDLFFIERTKDGIVRGCQPTGRGTCTNGLW